MRLVSARLVLRDWVEADRAPFHALSTDAEVMRFLLPLPTRGASDAWIDRQRAHFEAHGFGIWAVEHAGSGAFLGAVGLNHVPYAAHFTPAVEVGWRIARSAWGQGYAPEAARLALGFGFRELGLAQVVANAGIANERSQRVMAKIGMVRDPADDFDHPRIAEGDPLRRQVLYRIRRERWAGP